MHFLTNDKDEDLNWFQRQLFGSVEDKILPFIVKSAAKMADAMNEKGISIVFTTLEVDKKQTAVLILLDVKKQKSLPKVEGKLFNAAAVIEVVNIGDKNNLEDFLERLKKDKIFIEPPQIEGL